MTRFLLITVLALSLAGCNADQIAALSEQLSQTQTVLDQAVAAKTDIDTTIASLPEGELRDRAIAYSQHLQGVIDKASVVLPRMRDELVRAEDTLGVISAGVNAAAPLIPPPWGTIVAAVTGLALGLFRAAQNRSAARRIAASIEQNAGADGTINLSDPAIKDKVRSVQGATAGRVVDEAQGKVASLPF
jgi:hypothetical protein